MRAKISCRGRLVFSLAIALVTSLTVTESFGQSSISSVSSRPFVTGIIPVVGRNGAVGGVLVDADGMVAAANVEAVERLAEIRTRALQPVSQDVQQSSDLRKISLKRLQAAIVAQHGRGATLTDEMQLLAGLQQVRYVFVYPERQDIVLAGPAEGWRVDARGHIVGKTSGRPVLQLSDLVVCLRAADTQWAREAMACSIDPTAEGVTRVQRALLRRNWRPTRATLDQLQALLGPQQIKLTGVPAGSPLARTLVAADIRMKLLAMGLEPEPFAELPSYFDVMRAEGLRHTGSATPRWWLEPRYTLSRDPSGMAWQIGPGSVQAFSEEDLGGEDGTVSPADRWAEKFTEHYEQLARRWPVFSELQNGIELALAAAIIAHHELPAFAECDLSVLLGDDHLQVAEYPAPKSIPAHATAVRISGQWVVSVSGGVHVDALAQLQDVATDASLERTRPQQDEPAGDRWWWD